MSGQDEPLMVIAACVGCGRGFSYIHHEGVGCFCQEGSAWLLPEPEVNVDETREVRARRKALVSQRETYKADMIAERER